MPAEKKKRRKVRSASSGFTLIEVLVAMVLLLIGVVGAIRVASSSTQGEAQARDTVLATAFAQSILNETLTNPDLAAGTADGDFSPEHPEFRYESAVEDSAEETGLLMVSVTVYWRNGRTERQVHLATQVLDPATAAGTVDTTGTGTTGTAAGGGGGAGG